MGPLSYPENSREVTCPYRCTEPNFSPAIHPYLHNLLICRGKLISKVSKNILLQHLCDYESVRGQEERQTKGKGKVIECRPLFFVCFFCFLLFLTAVYIWRISYTDSAHTTFKDLRIHTLKYQKEC